MQIPHPGLNNRAAIESTACVIAKTEEGASDRSYAGSLPCGLMANYVIRSVSCFGADEWVEVGHSCEGPEGWPEWKQEDDLAYQQYLDEIFRGDKD